MRPLLAVLLGVGTLTAAPVPKDLKKPDDKTAIVGTWKPVRYNGKEGQGATAWFKFAADGTMRTWHEPAVGVELEWTWTLDPTATPKRAKLTVTKGSSGGITPHDCVYELDGETLKIGFITNPKAGVPEKVEVHPAIQLYEMTREKPAK